MISDPSRAFGWRGLAAPVLLASVVLSGCGGDSGSSRQQSASPTLVLTEDNAATVTAYTFGLVGILPMQLLNVIEDALSFETCLNDDGTRSASETELSILVIYSNCRVDGNEMDPDNLTLDGAMRLDLEHSNQDVPARFTFSEYTHTGSYNDGMTSNSQQFGLDGVFRVDDLPDGFPFPFMSMSDVNIRFSVVAQFDATPPIVLDWRLSDFSINAQELGSSLGVTVAGNVYLGAPMDGSVTLATPVPIALSDDTECHGHFTIAGGQGTSLDILLTGDGGSITLNGVTTPLDSCDEFNEWISSAMPPIQF